GNVDFAREEIEKGVADQREDAHALLTGALGADDLVWVDVIRIAARPHHAAVVFLDHADKNPGVVVAEQFLVHHHQSIAITQRRHLGFLLPYIRDSTLYRRAA